MHKALALVAGCAFVIAVPIALASEGNSTATPIPEATPSKPECGSHFGLHRALALKNWREKRPLAGVDVRCLSDRHIAKEKQRFERWRAYREVATYAGCPSGNKWLRYTSIPGSVVFRESGCSWTAVNSSSGACGPYQLLGWTSCDTSTYADKMRHHRMAAHVLAVQGPGAWVAW